MSNQKNKSTLLDQTTVKLKNNRLLVIIFLIVSVVGLLATFKTNLCELCPSICTDSFCGEDSDYTVSYEKNKAGYYHYLAVKQDFSDLKLFSNGKDGINIPINVANLYIHNQPLLKHLNLAIKQGQAFPSNQDSNKIVIITAPAGAGKSQLFKWLGCSGEDVSMLQKLNSRIGKILYVDLNRSFVPDVMERRDNHPKLFTSLVPELILDEEPYSRIPKIDFGSIGSDSNHLIDFLFHFGYEREFHSCKKRWLKDRSRDSLQINDYSAIIVDGFDEIANESIMRLIELFHSQKIKNPRQIIVLSGRGEAFLNYTQINANRYRFFPIHILPIHLNTPELIEWRFYDWLFYRYIEDANNILRASITKEMVVKYNIDSLYLTLKSQFEKLPQEVKEDYMFPLAPSAALFRNLFQEYTASTESLDDNWLSFVEARAEEKHGRPTRNNAGNRERDLYNLIIKKIAKCQEIEFKSYSLANGQIVNLPSFQINKSSAVSVGGSSYLTYNIIQRSGFVDIVPIERDQIYVSFFPPVMQEILAERQSVNVEN